MRQINWYSYNETITHPITIFILLSSIIWVFFSDKNYVIVGLIFVGLFVAARQRIVVYGIDFPYLRILIICIFIRKIIRNEYSGFVITNFDVLIVMYIIVLMVAYTFLWTSISALLNRIGYSIDSLGAYLVVRIYTRSRTQLKIFGKSLLMFTSILAFFAAYEYITHINPFGALGGVREVVWIRNGQVRVQSSFSHAILFGTYGATIFTFSYGLLKSKFNRGNRIIWVSLLAGIFITFASGSSGPILSLMAGLFAVSLRKYQNRLKDIIVIGVICIIALNYFMDAPVWHLLSRIDITGGSTGYHRYLLIDRAVTNLNEWMIFGIRSTAHWGWGLQDITNMYILQGVRGGIITLVLFILILLNSFKILVISYRSTVETNKKIYIWSLFAVIFTHAVSFVGVSYFGQILFFFFSFLGLVGNIKQEVDEQKLRNYAEL
ncbi:hypothetical protein B4O97_15930 [Marispirochaeta aestuarii]|uniref:O-antigen polymerase n=1 Tax=Marispirochaeta aestuarii TaxID=1963862 RepID=A0A1Y1RVF7_9SPIO|nr:hypothetical protein [Marispirochaeta aestuarii]ORC32647.1 hypothetical protein B4O97_15930 [Marispirochaeta aestuarii]